jgi:hypothetical protein
MKIKIIKQYELRPGRFWNPDQIADVTNDFGKEMIKEGYAREIRFEKRKDSKGIEFEVQVEVIDDKGTTISKLKDKK